MRSLNESGRHHRAKLTEEQVLKIRKLHAKNPKLWNPNRLGEFFGVAGNTIRPILEGKTWKNTDKAPGSEYWSGRRISAAGIAKIVELHQKGTCPYVISKATHIPHTTVGRYIEKWKTGKYTNDGHLIVA